LFHSLVITALATRWSRGAASADAMSAVKKDMKDMATSVNVGLANLQKPSTQKSLKAKLRARLHFVVALVGLGVVAAVGTYVAKRGLPDIDPVKVRGREGDDETRGGVSRAAGRRRAPNRKGGIRVRSRGARESASFFLAHPATAPSDLPSLRLHRPSSLVPANHTGSHGDR
jgi:hypothetical protein